jgi:PAN domain
MRTYVLVTSIALASIVCEARAQGVPNTDMPGGDYVNFQANTALACHNSCAGEPRCKAWSWVKATTTCFLKDRLSNVVHTNCCIAGDIDQGTQRDMRHETDTDRPGSNLRNMPSANSANCERACAAENACSSWSWVHSTKVCFLKNRVARPVADRNATSGVKFRPRNL